jgi:hypothetical protein
MAPGAVLAKMKDPVHRIIAVCGVDGSGKSTVCGWLRDELGARGYAPGFVWSRFNNYISVPFLAASRLSGHNEYREHAGVRMGFHHFERLPLPLRYLFIGTQAVDVNLATWFKVYRPSRHTRVTICERGPWDTLVDVAADTAIDSLICPPMSKLFCGLIAGRTDIAVIDRNVDLIEDYRPELKFDNKLRARQRLYRRLAEIGGWKVVENNGDLDNARKEFSRWLTSLGY